jgi:hypothetical protein
MSGDQKVVAGSLKTKGMEAANKVMPDVLKAEQHRRMSEPGRRLLAGGQRPSDLIESCSQLDHRWTAPVGHCTRSHFTLLNVGPQ